MFTSTGQGVLGNNMFAYCRNNPVVSADPFGYCSCALRSTNNNLTFSSMCPSCGCVGYGGIGGILIALEKVATRAIEGAAKISAWTFTAIAYSSATVSGYAHDTSAPRLADQSPPDGQYMYWEAYRVKKAVYVGKGISLAVARLRVANNQDVMCRNKAAAQLLLEKYDTFIGPEKDRGKETNPNYFWHFHLSRYSKVHIWYYEGV